MFPEEQSVWKRRLQSLLTAAQNWLAPSRQHCLLCGGVLRGSGKLCRPCENRLPWITRVYCATCGRYEPCGDCPRRKETYFVSSRSAVRYTPAMKELLARYKYHGEETLLPLFGDMLAHAYRMHLHDLQGSAHGAGKAPFQCLTFVPASGQRQWERGFDQARRLAEELGGRYGIPVISLLRRIRHTERQSFKTRKERLEDLKGAFAPDEEGIALLMAMHLPAAMRPKILIVDDVYTTGSTLNECAKTISCRIPVEMYGITWAR